MSPELIELRKRLDRAKLVHDSTSMVNVTRRAPEEQIELDIAHHRAMAELMDAHYAYQRALEGEVRKRQEYPEDKRTGEGTDD